MSINVEAVCEAWKALGGVVVRDKGGATLYEHLRHTHPSGIAAFVNPGRASVYADPETFDPKHMVDGVIAALPELARVWGVTKTPETLTWDEAAELWVSWGGVALERLDVDTHGWGPQLRLDGTDRNAVPYVFMTPDALRLVTHTAGECSDGTLTHDTLEDMAEACELPRTPGRLEAIAKEEVARVEQPSRYGLTVADFKTIGALEPRARGATETLGQRMARLVAEKKPEPKPAAPASKPADQYAEQTKAYNDALADFMA